MLMMDCSCREEKSQYKPAMAIFSSFASSHRVSITKELAFLAVSSIRFFQRIPPLTSDMFCPFPDSRSKTRKPYRLDPR